MNDASIDAPSPGSTPRPWSLACMLVLAACVLDTGGLGSTSANVGGDESGTTGVGATSLPASETTTAGQDDDPPAETGLDTTAAATAVDLTTGDDTSDTTGDTCMMECLPGWQCMGGGCINPDEGEPCGPGCGPAAPFCGPDGLCHDGTAGDPCDDGQCIAPLSCGPANVCHDGSEGDPCLGPDDCGTMAPLCTGGACHDGSEGDPCTSDGECADIFCGPTSTCQDGSEDDPCVDGSDCAAGSYCPWDMLCHDGNVGDPCTMDSQCDGFFSNCLGNPVGFCGL